MFVTSQCLLSLFVATIIFTGFCNGACDVGWLQNGDYCYFISNSSDVGFLRQAAHQCFLMDAQLARPETEEELNFLQTTIKDINAYGWLINFFVEDPQIRYFDSGARATITTNDIPSYSFYNAIQNNFKQFTPAFGSIPEVSPVYDADANHDGHCIAFHIPDTSTILLKEPWFEEVSCSLPLHVVCQINKTDSPNQVVDRLVWFEKKGMLYWLGDELVNFDNAKRTCKDKNMNLLDNIDHHAANFIREIYSFEFYDAVPIWSAATFSYSGLKWLTGEDVQVSEATYWGNKYLRKRAGTVLLNTGYVQLFDMEYRANLAAFPYICKKMNHLANKFDCPDHWTRAGRSCYYYTASYKTTWQKANDFCQERDSHLLKIDSVDEIIWLTESLKPIFRSSCQWNHHDCDYVWTSGTDKDKEGSFIWHDGSKIDAVIFPWRTDIYSDQTSKRCVVASMMYQYFEPVSCNSKYRPACQYPLPDSSSMCANSWFQYNGTCYYLDLELTRVPKDLSIAICRSKLEGSDVPSWTVKVLEIRSQEQFDYLTNVVYTGYGLWLGLEARDAIGQYTWKDGTVQDMTKWKDSYPSDDDDSPKHCVAADVNFQGNKRSCDNELYYVCEKELSSVTDAASFRGVPAIVFIVTLALMACRVGDFVVSG